MSVQAFNLETHHVWTKKLDLDDESYNLYQNSNSSQQAQVFKNVVCNLTKVRETVEDAIAIIVSGPYRCGTVVDFEQTFRKSIKKSREIISYVDNQNDLNLEMKSYCRKIADLVQQYCKEELKTDESKVIATL